jgi:RNA polymerase sigma-70 factor, ECF subfamily
VSNRLDKLADTGADTGEDWRRLVHDTVVRLDLNAQAAESRQNESALVAGLKSGSEPAYEQLISLYQQPVYSLVYRLLNDPGDAGDVVQEVFVKVFRNVHTFRAQSSLKTWVYRIALNEAHNRRRWFRRHRKQEIELGRDESAGAGLALQDTLSDGGASPFESALSAETQRLLAEALQTLSPNFREAVILRDVEGLSYEEISEVLGLQMGTVKSRILRGREALRKELSARVAGSGQMANAAVPTGSTGMRTLAAFGRFLPGIRTAPARGNAQGVPE